ncbi:MAG: 8-amino-7-oxononanoate synthase [Rhodocyclaceae bacterium]|nr:8-amino-7-oxononanoate synthase [Rhodocyclaceae bacterium]
MNIQKELAALAEAGLLRRPASADSCCGPEMILDDRLLLAFASNDYLGLAADPRLIEATVAAARRWGVGAGASHFLGGHFRPHHELQEQLAAFVGAERALFFSTGYMANLGVVPALAGRGDTVFADRLNHASLIDAVRLSGAHSRRYPHGDLAALEKQLAACDAGQKLILTDSVFSMDGDLAPLAELAKLAERHDAWLVVDDAHGFGVLGPQGRGALAACGLKPTGKLLVMGTLGKAAGVAGAFVAGDEQVIEWLTQKARTAIFTTAAPPMLAAALLEGLKLIEAADDRRAHLQSLIARLRTGLAPLCTRTGWRLLPSTTPIQPLVIGENHATVALAEALQARGVWAPAIRPPTVPAGQARLRISLSAAHTEAQVDRLLEALADIAP